MVLIALIQSAMPKSSANLEEYESDDGMPKANPSRSDLEKHSFRFYKRKLKTGNKAEAVKEKNKSTGKDPSPVIEKPTTRKTTKVSKEKPSKAADNKVAKAKATETPSIRVKKVRFAAKAAEIAKTFKKKKILRSTAKSVAMEDDGSGKDKEGDDGTCKDSMVDEVGTENTLEATAAKKPAAKNPAAHTTKGTVANPARINIFPHYKLCVV